MVLRAGHRCLDQAGHHARGREPDRVAAVPRGRQVDDADLLAGGGVMDGSRPTHPVVHHRREVLGREHHRGLVCAGGEVQGIGADAEVVPPAAGDEVDGLGLAAHDPPTAGPQDASVVVGHGQHEIAVVRRLPQIVVDAIDGHLQRRVVPERRCLALVGQRRLGDVEDGSVRGTLPAVEDLGADDVRAIWTRGVGSGLDERGPGSRDLATALLQAGVSRGPMRSRP